MDLRSTLAPLPRDCALCLGAFDGMHRGHVVLLQRARAIATKIALVTFEPHPAAILTPDRVPARLQTAEQRERWCRAVGVDALVVLPFDRNVANLSPEAFVQTYLIDGLRPQAVVVGEDFRYGAGRQGTVQHLADHLARVGCRTEIVAEQRCVGLLGESGKISSTRIRMAIDSGEVEHAAALLGRWYAAQGEIVGGDGRGRQLGFPTANFHAQNLLPGQGVYAGFIRQITADRSPLGWLPAVASVGTNPTFTPQREQVGLEVHVLVPRDQPELGNWYGAQAEFAFVAHLREQMRFADGEALKRAIANDIAQAQLCLTEQSRQRLEPQPL